MTPDKPCDHGKDDAHDCWIGSDAEGANFICHVCGLRFVPSDVLEEARRVLQSEVDLSDNYLPHFSELLARIDAVLGK